MKTKFDVEFKTEYCNQYMDGDYRYTYLKLLDVIPKSLSLTCPHCQIYSVMRLDSSIKRFETDEEDSITFRDVSDAPENLLFDFICSCPSCDQTIFVQAQAIIISPIDNATYDVFDLSFGGKVISIYPYMKKVVLPPEVPEKYAGDFREAVMVLHVSPMASAALSRRILQNILRDEYNIAVRDKSLASEINVFITIPGIPSYLTDAVDAIRQIGNLAAHPMKDTNTGEIVAVETGEAEWLIEVLNDLFDFRFVHPKKLQKRKDQLNTKLQNLGKSPMK